MHSRHTSCVITCFVAASERFLRVQRQFWTRRWLGSVKWRPKACMPPTHRHTITQQAHSLHQRIFTLETTVQNVSKTSNNAHSGTAMSATRMFIYSFCLYCVVFPFYVSNVSMYIPASTMAGLLLEQTESTLSTLLVVHSSFSYVKVLMMLTRAWGPPLARIIS